MNEACSIILTCYNKSAYVYAAMDCCMRQQSVEVLVVDDGSLDGSAGEIERSLRRSFKGCARAIYQRNGGAASARNRGLDNTAAPLLLFMDGDDLLPEGYIAAHLLARETLKETKFGVTYANFSRMYAGGGDSTCAKVCLYISSRLLSRKRWWPCYTFLALAKSVIAGVWALA